MSCRVLACALVAFADLAACSRGGSDGKDDPLPPGHSDGGVNGPWDAAADPRGDGGGGPLDAGADGARPADLSPDASAPGTDPFDPASCSAPALTGAQALSLLGTSARLKLADATLYRRSRSCTGMTPATCGAWSAPVPHQQSLLTYSGGVVTDYKTFSFPTHLILFAQAGQPKLVVRHESDYRKDASANTRGVVFPFGADPMLNTYPVIYVWDFMPAPNRYDDLQGLLGQRGELHAAEHCARVVFYTGLTAEVAALYRF
ncbi:MAG: hypothetical protein U1A78_21700 [Polyangia bacterium]